MNFKEQMEAALRSYDELLEKRNAIKVSDETRSEIEALDTELDAKLEEVRGLKAKAEREQEVDGLRSAAKNIYVPARTEERKASGDNAELRTALLTPGAHRTFEIRAAVLGDPTKSYSDASFGTKVLTDFINRNTLTKAGAVPELSATGGPISATDVDPVLSRTARDSALPETTSDSTISLGAYVYGGIVKIDNAHIEDSAFDLVGLVARKAGSFAAKYASVDLVAGTGGGTQPTGVLSGASTVAAGAAAITPGNLYTMAGKVPSATAWIMNSTTFAAIWSLNTNGLWAFDPRTGVNALLGFPVVIDENVPNIGANNKSVVLGDFADGYHLRVVRGVETQTLMELYAAKNQTGVKAVLRLDGVVTDSELVVALQHAAS